MQLIPKRVFGYFSTKLWLPTLVAMENCYDIFGVLPFAKKIIQLAEAKTLSYKG